MTLVRREPIVDWERLNALRDVQTEGEPDVVGQIIAMFDTESAARVGRARDALARGDAAQLRAVAHSLRGSAGLIGAESLRRVSGELEARAETAALAGIEPLVEAVAACVSAVRAELAHGGAPHEEAVDTSRWHAAASAVAAGSSSLLVADDDPVAVAVLSQALAPLGIPTVSAVNGLDAWERFQADVPPTLAVVDWMMPGLDGPGLCRRIRQRPQLARTYVILLTSRDQRADVVEGFDAGADDYVLKPFDGDEMRARVLAGARIVALQRDLSNRVEELGAALAQVKRLGGLLPICAYCKRIRTDGNYWEQVDRYITEHSEAEFTHGVCPPCLDKLLSDRH